jgi:hypothetical protein
VLEICGGVMLLKLTGETGGVDIDVVVGGTVLLKDVGARDVRMPGFDVAVGLKVRLNDKLN